MDNLVNRNLLIHLSTGTNEEGEETSKVKTFRNIQLDSTNENLALFGEKFSNLSKHTHLKTIVVDYTQI